MYDMYPDWGPAKHDPEHPLHRETKDDALQRAFNGSLDSDFRRAAVGFALRDEDGGRPDDN